MSGVVLESNEFLYLLRMMNARAVVGADNARLFPSDAAVENDRLLDGFQKLQKHGWLKPGDKSGRLRLDNNLTLMVAVVADPEYVILTARHTSETGRELVNHYLAANLVVELSELPDRRYQLAVVPNLPATIERIERVLRLPQPNGQPPVQFAIDEPDFVKLRRAVAARKRDQAEAILSQVGVQGRLVESLLDALRAPDQGGTLIVIRQRGGQVADGRRAEIFRHDHAAWVARPLPPGTPRLTVQSAKAQGVAELLDDYLKSLAGT